MASASERLKKRDDLFNLHYEFRRHIAFCNICPLDPVFFRIVYQPMERKWSKFCRRQLTAASRIMCLRVEAIHSFIVQRIAGIGTASARNRYMKVAIPTWRGRISPVFDVAEKILVEDITNEPLKFRKQNLRIGAKL
jgi:hypothetical protein